jgi:hypothetical protein
LLYQIEGKTDAMRRPHLQALSKATLRADEQNITDRPERPAVFMWSSMPSNIAKNLGAGALIVPAFV